MVWLTLLGGGQCGSTQVPWLLRGASHFRGRRANPVEGISSKVRF
jgi:hypothetical protein